ncbi:hypothetical protein CYMTET_53320 [Cymbomonas tetramitiformis]|uniref:Uncharacterized protein n=1 Tax=Cymbomonas tetramitiformis TaxID=36881 RepID=A0AAE0ERV0_9CHLO|nr:hypothetical protein CYMTET_53320 [Cymbomonas tetramitiformis]
MPSNYGNWVSEGSGRDSYIHVNNGGNQKSTGPFLGKGSPHFLKSTSERNFTFGAHPAPAAAYAKAPDSAEYGYRTYDRISITRVTPTALVCR